MDNSDPRLISENGGTVIEQTPCRRKGYLGETLREFRKKANMTQVEVAKKCGISATQYNYYEQGQYFPDTDKLIQICHCIEADPLAVFAVALDRSLDCSEEDVKDRPPVQIFENVAKAFHKKVNQMVEEEVSLL